MLYTKNPARLEANKAAKVANGAVIGRPHRKAAAKLASRVSDWEGTKARDKGDNTKGYHKPGSMQR